MREAVSHHKAQVAEKEEPQVNEASESEANRYKKFVELTEGYYFRIWRLEIIIQWADRIKSR